MPGKCKVNETVGSGRVLEIMVREAHSSIMWYKANGISKQQSVFKNKHGINGLLCGTLDCLVIFFR